MPILSFDRCRAEIVAQTDLLRSAVAGADLTAPVPTCPGWNLGQLLRHVGAAHRWVEEVVRTRASEPVEERINDLAGYTDEDAAVLDAWLADGAARLAETLREAGPDARVWTVAPGGTPVFWARRMVHETAVHRCDAALVAGAEFDVDAEVAVDALDEWMDFGTLAQVFEESPGIRDLLGPGRSLHLHATDAPPEAGAEWLVDLSGEPVTWRRAHEKAAVAVRGPLSGLLLTIYGRKPAPGAEVEIVGDAELFHAWLDCVSFWLRDEG
ncbi:uncharacterized protein (TIGR03083 family) [Saccharopolyspora erythraea NRRL 2338]|uniref:Uncharacterized protein n=2 Tax=Saccharopolyspora erythraea TaxID=1836 RepID=A4FAU6_SACEN|nr:maleylpyruvate isomerase family mycothiol-dependent enzyme [Saccharopolyspora erythraea]EQD87565.1 hypothetical protein N599_03265 [Saccharopolyspora erythraea D]PFG94953.1 uncharacterized protein (TIGR03083 family) [Saccharopolyspora erythraea NRRL 2338]QRK91646.1 maleylpyruvate isomerase N-terminal domain-containing protein [Saccharopolyspora erythraea]CAM01171.1 protein of unknown function DUF1503 [Saccharopolyspora erythraea NRRL 2338]